MTTADGMAFVLALGNVVRDHRLEQDMSLHECAQLVGWSDSAQSRAELGGRALSAEGLLRVGRVLLLEPATAVKLAQEQAFPLGWLHQTYEGNGTNP
jgi:transcriptional regulator with XRE-family HTH domain